MVHITSLRGVNKYQHIGLRAKVLVFHLSSSQPCSAAALMVDLWVMFFIVLLVFF